MLNWQTEARDGSFRTAPGSVYHLDFEDMVRLGEKFMELTPKPPKIFYIWGHSYKMDFGANIDAAKEAARFGIREDRAANYHADSAGTAVIYEAVSEAVCSVRACKLMSADWKQKVDEDYKKRG